MNYSITYTINVNSCLLLEQTANFVAFMVKKEKDR